MTLPTDIKISTCRTRTLGMLQSAQWWRFWLSKLLQNRSNCSLELVWVLFTLSWTVFGKCVTWRMPHLQIIVHIKINGIKNANAAVIWRPELLTIPRSDEMPELNFHELPSYNHELENSVVWHAPWLDQANTGQSFITNPCNTTTKEIS